MTTFIHRSTVGVLVLIGMIGCKDLAGTPPLPAGTSSPGIVQNATGAVQTAAAATAAFQQALADYIPVAGELTDELQANGRDNALSSAGDPEICCYADIVVDARQLDQATDWSPATAAAYGGAASDGVYSALQTARGFAYQAIGGLATYASDSVALRGEMYALLGYTEVMLADLFCSGVPLSTLDFQGGYTYQPSSTTTQVYSHAIALFDTAQSLAAANPQIVNLARVGQGRAYLALGAYASAGTAVSTVPTTFQFIDSLMTCGSGGTGCTFPIIQTLQSPTFRFVQLPGYTVSDREGGTGLPFISSGDPRTADTVVGTSYNGTLQQFYPKKYAVSGTSQLLLASGLEAQLITAEADLNASNASGMFTILNALRKNNPATSGLPILTDPGTFGAELDTLFTERAAWLFVDGHRQGDLRRLMRNYINGHSAQIVANQYPNGDYGFGMGPYGSFIDAPIPATELLNPHFTGCVSRD